MNPIYTYEAYGNVTRKVEIHADLMETGKFEGVMRDYVSDLTYVSLTREKFDTEEDAIKAAEREVRAMCGGFNWKWTAQRSLLDLDAQIEEDRTRDAEKAARIAAAKAVALDDDMGGWMERAVAEALRDKINAYAGEKVATLNFGCGPSGAEQVRQVWVNCGGRSYIVTTWREYLAFKVGVYGDLARAA